MVKLKSSALRRVILVITFLTIAVTLTACQISSNTGSNNRYKVNVIEQSDDFYVNDFAHLFSEADKQFMITNALELAEEYDGIQVVVTTVKNLDGNQIEEYAYSMYEQYGIGKDSMGILILLSVEDRDVRIETGKTMQTYITDSKSGQLLDKYGMEYFRNNQFAEGLKSVQEAVISEIKNVVPIDWNSKENVNDSTEQSTDAIQNNNKTEVLNMIFAILSIVWLVIIGILLIAYRKLKTSFSAATQKITQLCGQTRSLQSKLVEVKNQNSQLSVKVSNLTQELVQKQSRHEKTTQLIQEQYKKTYAELNAKLDCALQENCSLTKQLAEIQEFYSRVRKLHPECNFEKEVAAMIEAEFRAAVSSVDDQINAVINMPADKDSVEAFERVISIYETVDTNIRDAVSADIDTVRNLYQKSLDLRKRAEAMAEAEKIDNQINSVIGMTADKDNVATFANVLKEYNASSTLTQEFVKADISIIRSLHQESLRLQKAFEKEQQELRDKAEAKKVFDKMNKVYRTNPNGEYYEYDNLHEAYLLYEGLTPTQKSFFPNMEMLRIYKSLMKKANEAKRNHDVACKAEEDAKRAISSISGSADECDIDKISRAFRYYNNLNTAQKAYFSSELLNKLKRLQQEADDDHDYQERKRAERRSSSYSSSSSYHSSDDFFGSSHHSGLGGHPSGGGASRHF